ncbi:MAG: GGDEF domain-containing protein, partial [Desulfobacula sp.]|nr:GGDEF domain-containing protein [Desulfobacula sp.]
AAVIDPLTGCYNRREFVNQLKRNIAGASRHKNDLSLFIFDLDHFKKINDTYGHLAGDKVLQEISSLVQQNMRTDDIFARYGGEEFIAILPETDKIKAMELADRLRSKIAKKVITYNDDTIKITASFGVAQQDRCADMEKIIHDADTMLYKAKLNGRNIVMPGLIRVMDNQNQILKKMNSV